VDCRLNSARVVFAEPKSIIISSKYGEFCDFLNSDFGWTPTVVNLVVVHPKNIYIAVLQFSKHKKMFTHGKIWEKTTSFI
jgi:hypothetical protein